MTTALAALALAQSGWTDLLAQGMSSFVQRGGQAEYKLERGELVGTTKPNQPNSFLCTQRTYADFELEYEVKVDPRLNSGVQIRSSSVPGYKNGAVHGYQVEIDPSDRGFSGGIYDEQRRGWLQDLSKNEKARQSFRKGDWNRFRVVARGDRIQTWINGVPAADLKDDLTTFGFIGFQVHGVGAVADPLTVRWRRIRIRDLGNPSVSTPRGAQRLLSAQSDIGANWASIRGGDAKWTWEGESMVGAPGSGDVVTRQPHGACRLHLEFMTDDNGKTGQGNGNSGVYLQGRYEVQILNSAPRGPLIDECGAIYGVKPPDYAMALPAGQWQSYEIWFWPAEWKDGAKVKSARLTVRHNGTIIHRDVEVKGSTGAGQPEKEGPAPLKLQDHGHRIRFRNIWMAPL